MYFHLVWIKEKNWEKYDLDVLLWWWDEDFIRKFLWIRWVVIVSINEFKEEPETFWNIKVSTDFNGNDIDIYMQWEDIWERLYFIIFLWITPTKANYIKDPISEEEINQLIESNTLKIKAEDEVVRKQQELAELKEQKKYEESSIAEWLKIINSNIDHIEQLLKAWVWVISWSDLKQLDEYLNEMKKIRLWTNFNKMAMMVLEAHSLMKRVEQQIFEANVDQKFLVDGNSSVSNIDVLSEYFYSNKVSEKAKLQPSGLKTSESISSILWTNAVLFNLLRRDINDTASKTDIDEYFSIVLELIEYIVICSIIVITLMWLWDQLLWAGNFSLYLLPAMWWLWLLLYLLNSLELKWFSLHIVGFIALLLIYWWWLNLLLSTFAL